VIVKFVTLYVNSSYFYGFTWVLSYFITYFDRAYVSLQCLECCGPTHKFAPVERDVITVVIDQ